MYYFLRNPDLSPKVIRVILNTITLLHNPVSLLPASSCLMMDLLIGNIDMKFILNLGMDKGDPLLG